MKFNKTTSIETLQQYLIDYFQRELCMPTFEEIGKEFGWASKNAVYKKMKLLQDFGIIRKHLGKYTLNPEIYRFTVISDIDFNDSEYWKHKQEYINRIK